METALLLLQLFKLSTDAAISARAAYLKAKEVAVKTGEMTQEQANELDRDADAKFAAWTRN